MNQLLEWFPLVIFFVIFKLDGIYWATASLMLACVVLMVVHRIRSGRYKTMHVATAGVVLVLGSATLLLHDKRFIQWKPTILLGAAALTFLGSNVIGAKPLAKRVLEGVFSEPLSLTRQAWLLINLGWAFWFASLATANLYIAWNFPESVWVNFKVFGITIAMLLFMIPQVIWLHGKTTAAAAQGGT